MLRIAVIAEKGGIGKTTVTVNLAAILGDVFGRKVLAIDLDKQAQTTKWLGLERDEQGLYDTLLPDDKDSGKGADLTPLIVHSQFGVDVIRGGRKMALFSENAAKAAEPIYLLSDAMRSLANSWEYVFFDCPPDLGRTSLNALTAADLYLIPVKPDYLNSDGLPEIAKTIATVRQRPNPRLTSAGIVVIDLDKRTKLARQTREQLTRQLGDNLYEAIIHHNVALARSAGRKAAHSCLRSQIQRNPGLYAVCRRIRTPGDRGTEKGRQ